MSEKETTLAIIEEIRENNLNLKYTDDEIEKENLKENILEKYQELFDITESFLTRYDELIKKQNLKNKNILDKEDTFDISGNQQNIDSRIVDTKDDVIGKDEINISKKRKNIKKPILLMIGILTLSLVSIALFSLRPQSKKEKIILANPDGFHLNDIEINNEDEPINKVEIVEENSNLDSSLNNISSEYDNSIFDGDETKRQIEYEEIDKAIEETEGNHKGIKQETITFIKREKGKEEEKNKGYHSEINSLNVKGVDRNVIQKNKSPYEIKQGSVIPAILITEINTDLQGVILAQVSEDIYDSITGKHLLVPKGSKLYGRYESQIEAGQNRVFIVWDKLILTNGNHLDLLSMAGVDRLGNSGLKDKRSNHVLSLMGNAIFSSILNIANKVAGSTTFKIDKNVTVGLNGGISGNNGESTASPMEEATAKILSRSVDRKPTIQIRRGYRFNIIVNEDLELERIK